MNKKKGRNRQQKLWTSKEGIETREWQKIVDNEVNDIIIDNAQLHITDFADIEISFFLMNFII
jgi:hypothetical protein